MDLSRHPLPRPAARPVARPAAHGAHHPATRIPQPLLAFALAALALLVPAAARAAGGGPDAGGYSWADSDEPGIDTNQPAFNQTDLRTTYNFVGDDVVIQLPLPPSVFPTGFTLYGKSYTSFWLSSNGWLSFEDPLGQSWPNPANVPAGPPPNGLFAYFWDDWTLEGISPIAAAGPNLAGDGYTIFVRLSPKSDPSVITQLLVTIYTNGSLKAIYLNDNVKMKTARTVVGIENAPGSVGLPYMSSGTPLNGAKFRDDYAVAFFPKGKLDCATAPTPIGCPQPATPYSNAVGVDNVSMYNCSPATWHGHEKVFQLTLANLADLTVTLTNADGKNRALFVERASCSEFTGCIAGGVTSWQTRYLAPGTYYVVVDGATPADDGPFTLEVQCKSSIGSIPCPAALTGQSLSPPGNFSNWSCAPGLLGPENIAAVSVTGPTTLEATLTNASDPTLRVLLSDANGINPANPVCFAASATTVKQWNVATGTYYVTVDGDPNVATYDLAVRCTPRLQCPSPANVIVLGSPAPILGDTTGKADNVDTYLCAASAYGAAGERGSYTGPEDVYEFTLAATQNVSFLFEPSDPGMRLLLLRDCYEGSCVMEGGCAENLPAGRYRLVVDGLNGAQGPYTLTPVVLPPAPYNLWSACPECLTSTRPPFCTSKPDDLGKKTWAFDDGQYCGTGCDFSLFAVADCGTEMHFPLYDVETGHMRVFDVLQQRAVDLVATNDIPANPTLPASCKLTSTGPYVSWEDSGCSAIPCPTATCGGGTDCRTNKTVMDVSFRGSPVVCGVYRVDFLDWGGNEWLAYANCTADRTPQYDLYRDLCSALARYDPLPEGGIEKTTTDESLCPALIVSGTVVVDDVGCRAVTAYEVSIEQAPPLPANPQIVRVDLVPGQSKSVPWSYTLTAAPATLVFKVDPADRVRECSESTGSTVACGVSAGLLRQVQVPVCAVGCTNVRPPSLGNELRAVRVAGDAVFSWKAITLSPVSVYRLYKDADRRVLTPPVKIAEVNDPATTAIDVGAVGLPPSPVAYYQAVAVSCLRDLEGPY